MRKSEESLVSKSAAASESAATNLNSEHVVFEAKADEGS